jgi:uncharacterized protein YfaA (DUF2138 family)
MPSASSSARTRSGLLPAVLVTLAFGAVLGAAMLILFLHEAKRGLWDRVAGVLSARRLRIDTSQPTVVMQVRRLSRLESFRSPWTRWCRATARGGFCRRS